jgi:predicted nucleotidyltransferase
VFRLDRHAAVAALKERATRLIEGRPEVSEVRLFGSLATGRAAPGSDADILIVLRAATKPFLDRINEYAAYFAGSGVACDILPYTRAELDTLQDEGNPFIRRAWHESVLLAARS